MEIAVLIPCYNEEQTINKVIQDFKTVLPEATIYVYDNNSKDKTAEIAQNAGAIVIPEYAQGKGSVIRSMFRDIDADCYLMIDGDDTYPAEHAREMVTYILEGKADMVIGDRLSSTYFSENKRKYHNFGNRIVRALINKLFKGNIQDIMTGYRAFSKSFVKTFPVLSSGFEIETEMTIHALDKRFLLKELPIQYRDRPEGSESKLNTVRDGIKVLKTIFFFYRDLRPMLFFGFFAAILLVFAALLMIPVLVNYSETKGLVEKFPTLIVSGFSAIASILSFSAGLILDVLRKQNIQWFELELKKFRSRVFEKHNKMDMPPILVQEDKPGNSNIWQGEITA